MLQPSNRCLGVAGVTFLATVLIAIACSEAGGDAHDITNGARSPAMSMPADQGADLAPAIRAGSASAASREPTNITNVYAHATAGQLSPAVATAKAYAYVPSDGDGSVTVIDQATLTVVARYNVGKLVQHVVPSWDLHTLYANASKSNRLVRIDPATGTPGSSIPVDAPYNLYFTPDGSKAVVMAERRGRIDYYDPHTWARIKSVNAPCKGVNHADWSADGSWFVVSCEFSGQMLKMDSASGDVLGVIDLKSGAMPQDVRLAPDGTKFYVADMMHGGLWILNADATRVIGSIPTGVGAHGIYPSRDGTLLYVSNRGRLKNDERRRSRPGEGSVSVVDPVTNKVTATWQIPGGGSPDMGGVSADGSRLWLSGRYDSVVYVFDTSTGAVVARVAVPAGPHGVCVFPQPGRYSLGHTGSYR